MSHKLLKSLLLKAAQIQQRIDAEQKSKARNWVVLMRLKKIRLKITERLYQLSHKMPARSLSSLEPAVIKRK